ncbi:MAG: [Fe-Fe] hydrogenase large subunit C-terminal domain-containing protein [Candidatus Micrarchaeota archaeon]
MVFESLLSELRLENKFMVAQVAPALRVSIGEEFGLPAGTIVTGKLVGALKQIGFQKVFDTSTGADVVTVEEAHEFIERKEQGRLPLLTSCCPGFVSYVEHTHPELVGNLCSVKSPHEVLGVLIKTYFAEKNDLKPEEICVVSIMPCVIKKAEALRHELSLNGVPHVDKVLTTVECAGLLKEAGVDLNSVKEEDFDELLGSSSGAGNIFGATGGVLESVLRLYASIKDKDFGVMDFEPARGLEGVKVAEVSIGNEVLRVAVVNSLRNAASILNDSDKLKSFHFIEVMACFGGCVGGAGQPSTTKEKIEARRKALYEIDLKKEKRVSSDNPAVKKLYEEFLIQPGSEKAKQLLYTTFHSAYE